MTSIPLSSLVSAFLSLAAAAAEPRPEDAGVRTAADPIEVLESLQVSVPEFVFLEPRTGFRCEIRMDARVLFEPGLAGSVRWHRCMPEECEDASGPECWIHLPDGGMDIGYARDFVRILGPQTLVFGTSGVPELQASGADLISIERILLAPQREGVLVTTKVPGSNHSHLQCLLAVRNGRFHCLPAPGLETRVQALIPRSARIELWGMQREGNGFRMRYGVYFPGDPNCCPCARIEARLETGVDALRVSSVQLMPSTDPDCLGKGRGDAGQR